MLHRESRLADLFLRSFSSKGDGALSKSMMLHGFFAYGFAKNAMANIDENEEALFKKMAGHMLGLTDAQLQLLLANGQFEEIVDEI